MSLDWHELRVEDMEVTEPWERIKLRWDEDRGGTHIAELLRLRLGDERIGATIGAHSGANGFSSIRNVSSWLSKQSHGGRETNRLRRATHKLDPSFLSVTYHTQYADGPKSTSHTVSPAAYIRPPPASSLRPAPPSTVAELGRGCSRY